MLNEILGLLVRAGAPEELAERPLHLYMSGETGEYHGDEGCLELRGDIEVVSVAAYDADGCDCVNVALDEEKELTELVDLAQDVQHLQALTAALEAWKEQLAENERGGAVRLLHDQLREARELLQGILVQKENLTHQQAWLAKWMTRLAKPLEKVEKELLRELRSPANIERIERESLARLFTDPRSASEVESTKLDLGEEALQFFGLEYSLHDGTQIEWELREAYGWALSSGLSEEDRLEKLSEVLLKWRPEILNSRMFPMLPAFPPREGQTVEQWLIELWNEEARELARFVDRVMTGVAHGLRTGDWLALIRLDLVQDGIEEALAYQTGTHQGRAVLRLPEAVAYRLCDLTSARRDEFQAVKLQASDTPEILEVTLGLYDRDSEKFQYLDHALEAARLV